MTNYTNQVQSTNTIQNTKSQNQMPKLHAVYRLDFAIKLKEKGHMEVIATANPQKPWLKCWFFVETEAFLTDLQELVKEVKNERI